MASELVVVATSAAGLRALVPSPKDGQPAIIRLGQGRADTTDIEDIPVIYNAERERWVGPETELIRSVDQLDAQIKVPYTTNQLLEGNTDDSIAGGDVLYHYAALWNLGAAYAAGLTLEYRQQAMIFGTEGPDFKKALIGALLFVGASAESRERGTVAAWAATAFLAGGREWKNGLPLYEFRKEGWGRLKKPGTEDEPETPLPEYTILTAGIYGYMEAGAETGGGTTSYALYTRWTI